MNHSLHSALEGIASFKQDNRIDAVRLSMMHCENAIKSDDNIDSCASYHGLRFLFHTLGVSAFLESQVAVFYRYLKNQFQNERIKSDYPRVLISGAADFVIPVLVWAALEDSGYKADVTVLDRCPTPLILCKNFMNQYGTEWALKNSDILDFNPIEPFDLICSDRFLGFFDPTRIPTLLNCWSHLLFPHGRVLTSVTIRPNGQASAREKNWRTDSITKALERGGVNGVDDVLKQQILKMATDFGTGKFIYRDIRQIQQLFDDSSLTIRDISKSNPDPAENVNRDERQLYQIFAHKHGPD